MKGNFNFLPHVKDQLEKAFYFIWKVKKHRRNNNVGIFIVRCEK